MIYVALCTAIALLAVSLYYNWKFANSLLRIEDTLEECLDTIDEKYKKMSEVLSRPLFFDSPEVKQVVEDIRGTRNSLHKIAIELSKDFNPDDLEEDNVRKKEN